MPRISELNPAAALTGTELVPLDQSGQTLAAALSQFLTFIANGLALPNVPVSVAMQPVFQAASLALGRTAFGLLSAALADSGAAGHVLPFLDGNNVWSGTDVFQKQTSSPPIDLGTVAGAQVIDLSTGNNFKFIVNGAWSLGLPTNIVAGQSGILTVTQDAVGNRVMGAPNAVWKQPGGTLLVASTTSNAVDDFFYYVLDSTHIHLGLVSKGFA